MYLRALELQGFKSFPEKTRLTFEKDITAIVGPNGSGKSNISDAIRWVMGEQSSRSLRGGKMEDVIFGGTEMRKQVGFAEVSLIIDNSTRILDMDNTEAMITRRYYRSGESEYYINRKAVRLKDIHEILMDTGLGREGYSIIDQDRTAEILSLKSVDRRDIFEEAAGISRFRHRKEDSERKLSKTDENLTRINDKIAELELQVEPLRRQSEIAKKYLILRDQLRELEISLWMEHMDRLRAETMKLESDYLHAQEELARGQRELEEYYRSAETFLSEMQAKNLEDESVRAEISGLEARVSELENQVAVLNANLRSNNETIDRMTLELNQHNSRTDSIIAQIKEREQRLEQISGEKIKWSEEKSRLDGEISQILDDMGAKASELENIMGAQGNISFELSEKRERLSALASTTQELYDRDNSLAGEMSGVRERVKQAKNELGCILDELEKTESQVAELTNIVGGHMLKLRQRSENVEKLGGQVTSLTVKYGGIKSRIKLLSDMEREYEGYSKAVKTVMREAGYGVLKNIHGPVANLVRAEDIYAVAVETALGAAGQNIIVDTPQDGKSAIQYLKRSGGGRATFLPLSSIKPNELRERGLESCRGFVGVAAKLVTYEEKYENIYKNLLGRTVIVHNIDDAINISKQYGYRFRIVTLDGQVINAGGSMTGGSAARNTGIISRANEIKSLKGEERKRASELDSIQQLLSRAETDLKSVRGELESNQNELRQLEDSAIQLRANRSACDERITELQENGLSLRQEMDTVKSRISSSTEDIGALRTEIERLEKKSSEYSTRAGEITEGNEGLKELRRDMNNKLSSIQASVASLDAERFATEKSIEELGELSGSLTGDRERKETTIASIQENSREVLAQIGEKKSVLLKLEQEMSDCREKLAVISEEKREMEYKRNRADRETQDRNRKILDMERACSRLEQKRLASEMEEKQLVDKLWETYGLTVTAAQPLCQDIDNVSEATRRTAKLKRDINALGTPNIGAIDEFERVNGRYTFLTDQRDDIQKAKDELEEIISGITEQMEEIFSREFGRIAKEFAETFTELFGGGKASLELEDEGDILNCGIEIKAQPPGKSLKTITLLSGGEKAFTAIALYFAIQKVRPTPFCVMDEIEAALDEVNVLRFAQYMRRLSKKTQFVVITHRRGTMEEADMIYGVTMQEQGISKVICVDIEEAERAIQSA